MTLKPLFDKVVIKQEDLTDTTPSGIILTGNAKEKPVMATVVAVGPGGIIDGKEIQMQVKVGDKVLCSKYAGSDFKVDGKEFTIRRDHRALCKTRKSQISYVGNKMKRDAKRRSAFNRPYCIFR